MFYRVLLALFCVILVLMATSVMHTAITGQMDPFTDDLMTPRTEEERKMGLHCLTDEGHINPDFVADLEARIGKHISYAEDSTTLGPLLPDGTHQVIMKYDILTIGQSPRPAKAIGTLRNDDCSHTITAMMR
jgi:hypothetical protein